MFKFTVILSMLINSVSFGATPEVTSIFEDFQKSKSQFLSAPITKKDFVKRFKDLDTSLTSKYAQLKTIEKNELTVEGNQLALDLELLEPLRNLATAKITKDSCRQAKHLNAMNTTLEEKPQIDSIEKIITTLCK